MFSVFLHSKLLLDPPRVILAAFALGNGDINSPSWKSTLNSVPHFENMKKKEKNRVKKIESMDSHLHKVSNKLPVNSAKRLNTVYHIKHGHTDNPHC